MLTVAALVAFGVAAVAGTAAAANAAAAATGSTAAASTPRRIRGLVSTCARTGSVRRPAMVIDGALHRVGNAAQPAYPGRNRRIGSGGADRQGRDRAVDHRAVQPRVAAETYAPGLSGPAPHRWSPAPPTRSPARRAARPPGGRPAVGSTG